MILAKAHLARATSSSLLSTGKLCHIRGGDTIGALYPARNHCTRSTVRYNRLSLPVPTNRLTVTIGSDKQPLSLEFDTGSPATWVNPTCFQVRNRTECLAQGRYNPFTSNTANILDKSFNLTYGGPRVMGTYFSDDITIGTATATNQHFGVIAASIGADSGLFGAGRAPNGSAPSIIHSLVA